MARASSEWRTRIEKQLTGNGVSVEKKVTLMTAVMRVDRSPSISEVQRLCTEGATVDQLNEQGSTALCAASFRGLTDIARVLIDHNADINFVTSSESRLFRGFTPLMFAVLTGMTQTVRALIDLGAAGDRVSGRGATSYQVVPPGSNVMDLMCIIIDDRFPCQANINQETRLLLNRRCCRVCGTTSQNLLERHGWYLLGDKVRPEPQKHLHRCSGCLKGVFSGCARYCSKKCQSVDWLPGEGSHRDVCPDLPDAEGIASLA
jgi:ankyrin repeat protein